MDLQDMFWAPILVVRQIRRTMDVQLYRKVINNKK